VVINLARITLSHALNAQEFKVYRSEGHFDIGGWQEDAQSPEYFLATGVVYPAREKEIVQVPEADRVQGMTCFVTPTKLYPTRKGSTSGTSDQLEWQDERYKILQVMPWDDYGFNLAVAVRLKGA
jgi:hypothetical protein